MKLKCGSRDDEKGCVCFSAPSDSGASRVPYFGECHCCLSVAQDWNLKVIITSLLFLTPHIQLAAQSCWLYDLNMFGIWPLLSAALSSFCVDFVIALELVSPALAGSFPRNSSPLPPHLSSYDLGYIISLLQSYKEPLLYTAWSEGSSNRYWNYSSMARWSMDPLVWFIMELWKRRAIMENHR